VTVKVEHALPGVRPLVDDEPVTAIREPEAFGHLSRCKQELTEHFRVVSLGVLHPYDVALGNDQGMGGRDRPDVLECEDVIVLEHDLSRSLSGDDVAKETACHAAAAYPSLRSWARAGYPLRRDMCGRTALTARPEDLREAFGLDETPVFAPHYNVPPSRPLNVVRVLRGSPGRRLEQLRWGLVPFWAEGPKIGQKLALARVENVLASPAFREAIRKRRCLVAVDGFFEWMREGKKKSRPFFVRRVDRRPFALAGVWDRWVSEDGEVIESCAILTQEARPPVDAIHDRMPLVLEPTTWDRWLDASLTDAGVLAPLLEPQSPELLAYEVGTHVNDPNHDDSPCLDAAQPQQRTLFQ
jgi:putative SOS response-associated peptidase YedK